MKIQLYKSKEATMAQFHSRKVNLFMADQARRLMEPYVPASSDLSLSRTANTTTQATDKKGIITYTQKYAHYQYVGKLYVSPSTGSSWAKKNEEKIPTDRDLVLDKMTHPLATKEWDKAMMVAKGRELEKSVKNYIKRHV